jgi:hypothetical protein
VPTSTSTTNRRNHSRVKSSPGEGDLAVRRASLTCPILMRVPETPEMTATWLGGARMQFPIASSAFGFAPPLPGCDPHGRCMGQPNFTSLRQHEPKWKGIQKVSVRNRELHRVGVRTGGGGHEGSRAEGNDTWLRACIRKCWSWQSGARVPLPGGFRFRGCPSLSPQLGPMATPDNFIGCWILIDCRRP